MVEMESNRSTAPSEGLRFARLLMVLSSISPLFVIWAVRGNCLLPDRWLWAACASLVVIPNGFLVLRLQTAKRLNEKRTLTVGSADDHRDHILVYLFAMLLPFYADEIATWRHLWSTMIALAFIVFLFVHLNLHYMNVVFAACRYRVFTITPPKDDNPISGRESVVLITRRLSLRPGDQVSAYLLSDTVYMELNE
jgi:hypothetical protein